MQPVETAVDLRKRRSVPSIPRLRAALRSIGILLLATFLPLAGLGIPKRALTQDTISQPKAEQLLSKQVFDKKWAFFSPEKNAKLADTWKLVTSKDAEDKGAPVLVCLGKPIGYLRSVDVYGNYEFGLEWKYASDPNGNSGILIHMGEEDRIWPTSIQVQLHAPKAGSIFPTMGAKTDNTVNAKDLSRPIEQWNSCVITSFDGKISVVVNEKKVGEVTGCMPSKGRIALQSEGSEVHFRNVWMRAIE